VPETALEGTSTHVLASSLAAVSPGQFLKQQREKHGIPIKAIADKTKVTRTTLQRIEDEEYTYLPAAVYLRGFIITYAKLVQVADPAQLASQYLQQMHQHTDPAAG
jgi:cytoskeletal protein RodZ